MKVSDTVNKLTKIIIVTLNEIRTDQESIKSIDPEEDLIAAYGVSSVQLISLIIRLEEAFSFTISDSDLDIENFKSVRALSEMLEAQQS